MELCGLLGTACFNHLLFTVRSLPLTNFIRLFRVATTEAYPVTVPNLSSEALLWFV